MTALIVHGHFYQPPRENPWTGEVDPEPGAAPFHDWNERIHAECYAPNIVNYPLISFNFGPTLLSWLESHHRDTYEKILIADRESECSPTRNRASSPRLDSPTLSGLAQIRHASAS